MCEKYCPYISNNYSTGKFSPKMAIFENTYKQMNEKNKPHEKIQTNCWFIFSGPH